MATKIVRPTGQGFYDNWSLGVGGSKPVAMADSSNATYISGAAWGPNGDQSARDAPSPRDSFVLADAGLTGAVIDSVTAFAVAYAYDDPPGGTDNVNNYFLFFRRGGANVDSTFIIPSPLGFLTISAALSRPGSGSWLAEDLAGSLEVGGFYSWHHGSGTVPDDARLADIWAEIAYHYPGGGEGGGSILPALL